MKTLFFGLIFFFSIVFGQIQDFFDPQQIGSVYLSNSTNPSKPQQVFFPLQSSFYFSFDWLSQEPALELYYQIFPADQNFELIDPEFAYLKGFAQQLLSSADYRYSQGTQREYVHYQINFPNRNTRFTYSGNYIVRVFDREKTYIEKRFILYENLLEVKIELEKRETEKGALDMLQIFSTPNSLINTQYLQLALMQNQNWQSFRIIKEPLVLFGNQLQSKKWDFSASFLSDMVFFPLELGLNQSNPYVSKIERNPFLTYFLLPHQKIASLPLQLNADFRGNFFLDDPLAAEYAEVTFINNEKIEDLYLFGAFSAWQIHDNFKVKFLSKAEGFGLKLLLKEGKYNYAFVYKDRNGKLQYLNQSDLPLPANTYQGFLYYKDPLENRIRVVGAGFL